MAKNKNQNRQREQHQDQQRGSAVESAEQPRSHAEERVMPSAPQSARKQQKRFGHN